MCRLVPKFVYFPEGAKSWLIAKENVLEHAQYVFKETKIKVTSKGEKHLGAIIGSNKFKQNYAQEKMDQWIKELWVLCKIAWCEPQAAFSCFITGFKHKQSYSIGV